MALGSSPETLIFSTGNIRLKGKAGTEPQEGRSRVRDTGPSSGRLSALSSAVEGLGGAQNARGEAEGRGAELAAPIPPEALFTDAVHSGVSL